MYSMKVIFVGSLYLAHKPDDGETMKNAILLRSLERHSIKTIKIDLRNRWQRIFYLIKYVFALFFLRDAKFLFSASSMPTYKLLRLAKLFKWKGDNIIYWVIGGNFGNNIQGNLVDKKWYADLYRIIVEGEAMKNQLNDCGLDNVMVLPNMKEISYIPHKKYVDRKIKRFVFLSRIIPQKGVDYIIQATNKLVANGVDKFVVDFYGRIDPGYEDSFKSSIKDNNYLNYKGFLDLGNKSGYDVLASYDAMLFPTYWQGEGFPGIIIDAFVAGLPVIASDWNLNTSLIKDSYNGVIVPVHNIEALMEAMKLFINGILNIKEFSNNAQNDADKYNVDNVINRDLLQELKLI